MTNLKDSLCHLVGDLAARVRPDLLREIETGTQTGHNLRLKRWIVEARTQHALRQGDPEAASRALIDGWHSETANQFYYKYPHRFERWFLGPHHVIVDEIEALVAEAPLARLVEIGCGDGRVLQHCAARMATIPDCIGLDINPAIIARNRQAYAGEARLSFVEADAEGWIAENAGPGTLLLTYGGVMEYFDRRSLGRIFRNLARQPGSAIALVEPVDPEHDLASDPGSHSFGFEHSFSHNHAAILAEAGFATRFSSVQMLDGIRWALFLTQRSVAG